MMIAYVDDSFNGHAPVSVLAGWIASTSTSDNSQAFVPGGADIA